MAETLPPAVLDLIVNTAEWVTGLQEAVASLQELNASIVEATGMVTDFSAAMATSMEEAAAASAEASTTIVTSADAAAASLDGLATSADAAGASSEASGSKFGLVAAGMAAAAGEAIKMAADFDTATTQLVTSAGESSNSLEMVRQGLLDMAGSVGVSATDLAKAMYYVESAGFHAQNGLTVLQAAAQGAKAEGADTTTVVKALTTVLDSYGLTADKAAGTTSQMIAAVSFGKTNLQNFSASLASIVPMAANAGISFADVSGALSEMTAQGFPAQRSSMNLANALRSMLSPTKTMVTAFAEYGVSSSTLREKLSGPNGLTDGMEYLSQAASKAGKEGTPEFEAAMRKLIGTAAGANAAVTVTGSHFKDTTAAIEGVSKATTDAQGNVRGFAEVQKTFNQQISEAKDKLNSMVIELGNALMPTLISLLGIISKVSGALSAFINYFQNHTWIQALVVGILAIVGALKTWMIITKAVAAAQGLLKAAFVDNPIGAIILLVVGLVAAFVYLWNHSKAFRDFWIGLWNDIKAAAAPIASWFNSNVIQPLVRWFKSLWPIIKPALDDVTNGIKQVSSFISGVFKAHGAEINKIMKDAYDILWASNIKPTLDQLVIGVKFAWDIVKDVFQTAGDIIKTIVHSISLEIQGFVNFFGGLVRLIYDIITGNWKDAWGAAKQIVQGIVQGIEGVVVFVIGIGKDIIFGLIRGIESAAGALWSTIKNIGNSVVNTFKSVMSIFSPSGVMDSEVGQNITLGIAQGMLNALPSIHGAISTIKNTLTGAGNYGTSTIGLGIPTGVAGLGGGPGGIVVINNNVAGTVVGETQLSDVVRQQVLRYNLRNPTNGLSLFGRGST